MLVPVFLVLSFSVSSLGAGKIGQTLGIAEDDVSGTIKKDPKILSDGSDNGDTDGVLLSLSVDSIDLSGMSVSWRVNDTIGQRDCTFELDMCHAPVGCYEVLQDIPWDVRSKVVPYEPFVEHNITVRALCKEEDGGIAQHSMTVRKFTAFAPSRVNVTLTSDQNSLKVVLDPPEEERPYIAGYWVGVDSLDPEYFEELSSNDTTMVFHNLTPATQYTVFYMAYTLSENETKVDGLIDKAIAKTLPPSHVLELRYELINSTTIRLHWDEPAAPGGTIVGYHLVVRDVETSGEVPFVRCVDASQFDCKFSSTDEYKLYDFTVAAYVSAPRSQSKRIMGETRTITARTGGKYPAPPEHVGAEVISPHEVKLSWKPSSFKSDIQFYKYRIQCSTGQMQVCFSTIFTTEASVELRDLQAFSRYEVQISACGSEAECGHGVQYGFSTPAGNPSPPRSLKALRTEQWMVITWEPPEHREGFLDGYELGFCLFNEKECPLNEHWEPVERTQTSAKRAAHNEVSKVLLKAYNKDGVRSLYSDVAEADVENEKRTKKPPFLLGVAIIAIAGAVITGVYYLYRRRRFSKRDRTVLVTANLTEENAEIQMNWNRKPMIFDDGV